MKTIFTFVILFVLSVYTPGRAQVSSEKNKSFPISSIASGNNHTDLNNSGIDYFNTHSNELKDENGNPIFDSTPEPDSLIITGEAAGHGFGHSVACAGDLNNDGYSDIAVGAYGYSINIGKVYIYFGGPSVDIVADRTLTEPGVYFGYTVASAGDVNGDGYSDLLVGTVTLGKVYLYYGGSNMNTIFDLIFLDALDPSFGNSFSCAGNVNGDAYSDIIIGADGYSNQTGRAYIFLGGSTMNNVADITITGSASGDRLGISVASAGNVNGDAYSDVIVGSHGYNLYTGKAYIYYGAASMNNVADVTFTGESTTNYFGVSVSSAGDVNKDTYSDVIIGAQGYNNVTGRAYIFYGGTAMNNTADIIMNGETANNFFGNCVARAGDINGDGYSDVIVGAQGYNSNMGRAYVFYGGASMNNLPDITLTGEAINDKFGFSVSTAGDLRADGFSDFIIGAYDYNSTTGRAYVYLKKPLIEIDLKVLIEGLYYPLFNSMARKEPVTLYLRNASSPYSIVDSINGEIDSISFTGHFTSLTAPTGKYYLVVKQFNSIETWSRSGGDSLKKSVTANSYDFTTASSMAYGNNLKLKGSKYCIYSGDPDRSGYIDVGDVVSVYNESLLLPIGYYLPEDINGDNTVDASDVVICYNNSRNLIGLMRP